jgi:membrane associated rhomboid family serine protease
MAKATSKQRFEILVDALKRFQERLFNVCFTSLGLMVGGLGWIVSSKDARAFLGSSHPAFRVAACLFLSLCVASQWWFINMLVSLSKRVAVQLQSLSFVEREAYQHYEINRGACWFIILYVFIGVLFGLAIWSCRPETPESAQRIDVKWCP